jgi:hypothetical protein
MSAVSKILLRWFEKDHSSICQVLKIHPVCIIILQDEGYNKFDHNIIFGGIVTTVLCTA